MLTLDPAPTFWSKVTIPTPEGPVDIKVKFKHMDKDEYKAFVAAEAEKARSDEDAIMDIAEDWREVGGPFDRENVAKLCNKYHAAAGAICEKFVLDLTQAKLGN